MQTNIHNLTLSGFVSLLHILCSLSTQTWSTLSFKRNIASLEQPHRIRINIMMSSSTTPYEEHLKNVSCAKKEKNAIKSQKVPFQNSQKWLIVYHTWKGVNINWTLNLSTIQLLFWVMWYFVCGIQQASELHSFCYFFYKVHYNFTAFFSRLRQATFCFFNLLLRITIPGVQKKRNAQFLLLWYIQKYSIFWFHWLILQPFLETQSFTNLFKSIASYLRRVWQSIIHLFVLFARINGRPGNNVWKSEKPLSLTEMSRE